MDFTEEMLSRVAMAATGSTDVVYQGQEISFAPPYRRVPMLATLSEALGVDVRELSEADLRERAETLDIPELEGAGWGKLIDELFGELVQPYLIQPTFVMDHPKEIQPSGEAPS